MEMTAEVAAGFRHTPFTEEHEMFRKSVRAFVEHELNPHVDAWEAAGVWPAHDVLKKMGDLGFLGLNYPADYGGVSSGLRRGRGGCLVHGGAGGGTGSVPLRGRADGHPGAYRYVYPGAGEVRQR